jgi:hypothetical protein
MAATRLRPHLTSERPYVPGRFGSPGAGTVILSSKAQNCHAPMSTRRMRRLARASSESLVRLGPNSRIGTSQLDTY